MKLTKKLLALALVLAMVLAMAVTVSAADTGEITVGNRQSGQSYTAYKVFDIEYNAATGAYAYVLQNTWTDFADYKKDISNPTDGNDEKISDYFAFSEANGKTYVTATFSSNSSDSAIAAKLIKAYITEKSISGTAVPDDGLTADWGYYLLDSDLGTTCALGTLVPASVGGNAELELREKNTTGDLPKIEKTYADGSTSGSYSIGDTVEYKIVITAKESDQLYTVHDKFKDIEIDYESFSYTLGTSTGATMTKKECTTAGVCNECNFHINLEFDKPLNAYDTITITYKAKVTGNNPINDAALQATPVGGGTESFNYGVTLKKTDGTNQLDGAKFVLYKVEESKSYYAKFNSSGVLEGWTDNKSDATEIEVGSKEISGLAAGTYYLKETVAPAGYKTLTSDVFFTISETIVEGAPTGEISRINCGSTDITVNEDAGTFTISVKNTAHSALPETGGIGTTIFYSVGAILVLAAVVLLATKKRSASK